MPDRTPRPTTLPQAADPAAAQRLIERFAELGRTEARFVAGPGAPLLRAIGGNSPYLSELALREHAALRDIIRLGPDAVVAAAMADLATLRPTTPRPRLAAALRQAKRSVALATAVADITGQWPLERITEALAALAETALQRAVAHLLRAGHDAGELRLPNPEEPEQGSAFTVLGMGKLGARELNYSSDIDLILLQDPDQGVYHGESQGAFYTRLSRDLVTLMEFRDADGYVFRTDLRLRPDPAATPPCIALPAAIAYYESMGQNWERAAMLKARPLAGDIALGTGFLQEIRPFIWRRHLDFAAIADIHAMKRRIDEHKRTALTAARDPVVRILGHNVKLGRGGIREIEFIAQTLQLVWGGRDPALRVLRTREALKLLVRAGHVKRRSATELDAAYVYLRGVEHRLQMVADRQTHVLPDKREELERFAIFMGEPDAAAFATRLLGHLERVQARYGDLFDSVPEPETGTVETLDFSGVDLPEATVAAIVAMGYANPAAVIAAVRAWNGGRVRALRSQRSREMMRAILPQLLAALARQAQPDAAFARFDEFIGRLAAGVQILSLFQRRPALMDRVAVILGAAPSLSDHLARTPAALEALLAPDTTGNVDRLLRARLADARTLEDAIAIIRGTVREEEFAISVGTLEGRLDADAAGLARTLVADAALSALLPLVLDDFARRFGRVKGGSMAVVLLGKAGGREMMAGSDLDLMFIYDHPEDVSESRGGRPLAASQWFIRAVHAFVAALTAPDADGPLFAVDMRLRPSGNKGPVAVSLAGFERYHAAEAWTWERMALTRARVVAGPARLRARVERAIRTAIAAAGEPARIRADAAAMRARLLRELPPAGLWDVKLRAGGQIEVEFIAQTLQLLAGHPAGPATRDALASLLPEAEAAPLLHADKLWRTVQGMLRILYGRNPGAKLSEAAAAALLAAARETGATAVDLPALIANLDAAARDVRAAFIHYVGAIEA
ncbi:MAG: bifunctional [glutamine synthetase] adenylyltransferase/[glutamine synthetase]-adenylyl-L-tyrosine phosphorylase [Alphaproteobacteria bacterium]|nr:bifunctional [glutamine synthetase] adenylyltransferase/[glutamine synthetase]-adenylyl-L-tyrosine phosphorylase [Alphaproteobacteria bacterium]